MPPPSNKRKPVRLLSNLKIAEVSVVDHAAAPGAKIMMRKRDGKPDYEAFFGRIFGVKKKRRIFDGYPPELCKNLDVSEPDLSDSDAGMPDEDDDERDADDSGSTPHFLAGIDEDNGATGDTDQLERAERGMETTMKSYNQLMRDVIKRHGLIPFCKSVAQGEVSVSEHELTKLICEAAERADTTFGKFSALKTRQA